MLTYDNGTWYSWAPGPAPDSIDHLIPGWGYWVLMNESADLVVGGSLLLPGRVPPGRDLTAGWNLIGYYGTQWQSYNGNSVNGHSMGSLGVNEIGGFTYNAQYFPIVYRSRVYCALQSLVDTQVGYPRWSSLWGYYNHGLMDAGFFSLNLGDWMYAGEGYWIEMDRPDHYAPTTTCNSWWWWGP